MAVLRLKDKLPSGVSIDTPRSKGALMVKFYGRRLCTEPLSLDYTPPRCQSTNHTAVAVACASGAETPCGINTTGSMRRSVSFEDLMKRMVAYRAMVEKREREHTASAPDVTAPAAPVPTASTTAAAENIISAVVSSPSLAGFSEFLNELADGLDADPAIWSDNAVYSPPQAPTPMLVADAAGTTGVAGSTGPTSISSAVEVDHLPSTSTFIPINRVVIETATSSYVEESESEEESEYGNEQKCIEIVLETATKEGEPVYWAVYEEYYGKMKMLRLLFPSVLPRQRNP
ncbi:hypothetical protein Ndes2526B_g03959 [Nannochloris sp. 'desiccata']